LTGLGINEFVDTLSTSDLFQDSWYGASLIFIRQVYQKPLPHSVGLHFPEIFLYLFAGGYIVEDT